MENSLSGYTLGQYEIVEKIGQGGMSIVYRAVQPSIGREVAIKVLPAHMLRDPTFLERFNREVRTVAGLEHPRIIPVYDYGEQDGLPYIVMRYLPGGNLIERIRRSPGGMPLGDIARIVGQIAEGLDFAHRRNIIHRDFKPGNVLLDGEGNAYLADFGIAKVTGYTLQLTGSGIIGTPAYLAPEMTEPGSTTHLIDIYALGITLFEMLTGRLPFDATTPVDMMLAHRDAPVPFVREFRSDLPDAIQWVLNGALAKDPYDRYQRATQLADDLRATVYPQAAAARVPPQEETEDYSLAGIPLDHPAILAAPQEVSDTVVDPLGVLLADPSFGASVRAAGPPPDRGRELPPVEAIRQALDMAFPAGQPAGLHPLADEGPAWITCPVCGTDNPRRERHCASCGERLPRHTTSPSATQPPPLAGGTHELQTARRRDSASGRRTCPECGTLNGRFRRHCLACGASLNQ